MRRHFKKVEIAIKIQAFTIVELMVSMVILVTVISIGVLLWNNVVRGIGKFQNDSDLYYSYVDLTTQLEQDLSSAVSVDVLGRVLTLTNDATVNTYTFYPDSVVRESNNINVRFSIKSSELELLYKEKSDLVNGLSVKFNINGKPINFQAYKPVRGRFLINLMFEDGN